MDQYFKLDVHVTKDDIEKGIPLLTQACPIAYAITEAATEHFPADHLCWSEVDTDHATILVQKGDQIREYDAIMPNEAQYFIEEFDNRIPTQPFSFLAEFWLQDQAYE